MFNRNFLIGVILAPIIYFAYNAAEVWLDKPEVLPERGEEVSLLDINFIPTQMETYAPTDQLVELSQSDTNFKKELNLSHFADKPTIVHVWAPWCGACTQEMVELDSFAKDCGSKVNLVAVGIDQQNGDGLREFYNDRGIANLKIYQDQNGNLSKNLRAHGLPTTIFYIDGKEIGRVIGPIDWIKYKNLLKKKLGV